MAECPYTGLMPFTEAQAEFFFGREAEREIITANLQASRLTLLYGPSGVGKSSVINAGVVHQLRAAAARSKASRRTPEFAIIVFQTWRDDPLAGLAHAIASEIGQDAAGATLEERLRRWTDAIDGDLLIILDQFEEYFLYHSANDGPGSFAVEFPAAVNRLDLRVSFLVSMREDSIAKLDFFKGRIPNLFDNYLRIDHLEREQARDAIVKPVERFNLHVAAGAAPMRVEPALVEAVLNQVTTGRVAISGAGKGRLTIGTAGQADRERVETPYLQLVMTRLWQEETSANSNTLRAATLERLGGAGHIVATHLDAALGALNDAERDSAGAIFQYLVTPSGTKIALGVDDLAQYAKRKPEEIQALLLKLSAGENRILTPVAPPPGQPVRESYQIFHDVLAAAVLDWRNRYVRAKERAAADARAEEQRKLTEEQRQRAEREAEAASRLRRQKRQLVILLVGMGLLLAVVGWLSYVAVHQQKQIATAYDGLTRLQQVFFDADTKITNLLKDQKVAQTAALTELDDARKLLEQAADATRRGDAKRADALTAQANDARTRAQTATTNSNQIGSQIAVQQQVSANARQQAEDLSKQLPTGGGLLNLPGGTTLKPPPPGGGSPSPTPVPTGTATVTPPATPTPTPPAKPKTGVYKDAFTRGIKAFDRRQWADAKKGLEEALSDYDVDTGERINISGAGNFRPYVPRFYLGVVLRNQGNCAEAERFWQESEKSGAIKNAGLEKELSQERAKCGK